MTTTLNSKTSELLDTAGLNYTVSKVPAAVKDSDGNFRELADQFHLVRSTDGAVISPATVSKRYAPTNPQQMVAPLEPLVSEGWITPDRGFLFKDGSYEVVSYRIDGGSLENQGNIAGESWSHFVSVHNHQGGGGKLKGSIHSHRIICQNTAVAAARMASFGIRHTGEIQANYEWAVGTWKKLQEEIREISKRMEVFASSNVSATEAVEILAKVYGVDGTPTDDISTRTANELEFAIREFSNPQRGTFGKSLYDVYNAITATNSHYAPKGTKETQGKRLASMFDEQGSRHRLEVVTMDTLLELAGLES